AGTSAITSSCVPTSTSIVFPATENASLKRTLSIDPGEHNMNRFVKVLLRAVFAGHDMNRFVKVLLLAVFAGLVMAFVFVGPRLMRPTAIATLKGHTDLVWSVAYSPDGKMLASGSWDPTIKLWDVATGKV